MHFICVSVSNLYCSGYLLSKMQCVRFSFFKNLFFQLSAKKEILYSD